MLLGTVFVTFWYTWLFNRSGGSVFITIVAHAADGLIGAKLLADDGGFHGNGGRPVQVLYCAAWLVVAVVRRARRPAALLQPGHRRRARRARCPRRAARRRLVGAGAVADRGGDARDRGVRRRRVGEDGRPRHLHRAGRRDLRHDGRQDRCDRRGHRPRPVRRGRTRRRPQGRRPRSRRARAAAGAARADEGRGPPRRDLPGRWSRGGTGSTRSRACSSTSRARSPRPPSSPTTTASRCAGEGDRITPGTRRGREPETRPLLRPYDRVVPETILTEQRGDVLLITLNRPEKLNAWNTRMGREL